VLDERGQASREQAVLVLGPLGPCGDEIGEPEVVGRRLPGDDPTVFVPNLPDALVGAGQVLADVVEVDVDRRRVAPACPLLCRRLEHDLDVRTFKRLLAHEHSQALVNLMDHAPIIPRRTAVGKGGHSSSQDSCPKGHCPPW
jgi:hypothetical protein